MSDSHSFKIKDDEYDECEQEHGSPCTSGGLHMPNSHSLQAFASRVKRLRYYSQCAPETTRSELRTGENIGVNAAMYLPQTNNNSNNNSSNNVIKVRRANSCPEMKKNYPLTSTTEVKVTLDESDELSAESNATPVPANGIDITTTCSSTVATQTLDLWPMPYEHLFLGIFPLMETSELKPSPAPSPAPNYYTDKKFSPYETLDKYIEQASKTQELSQVGKLTPLRETSETKALKEQLKLLHIQLQYERHRREVHAIRNRRLLGESRSNRALEEHNAALRDQLGLLQREIESLHGQLKAKQSRAEIREIELREKVNYWHDQCIVATEENGALRDRAEQATRDLAERTREAKEAQDRCGKVEAKLFEAEREMAEAIAQAKDAQRYADELKKTRVDLLLAGELNQRYRDRMATIGAGDNDAGAEQRRLLAAAYQEEVIKM